MLASEETGARLIGLEEFSGAPALVEDGATLAENAARKATQLAAWLLEDPARLDPVKGDAVCAVLADDSGLEVDVLGGQPGVQSARFAAPEKGSNSTDGENNAKLLRMLADTPLEKRTARFRCFLAFGILPRNELWTARDVRLFEGVCEGIIGLGPRGEKGFGYDPLFTPAGQTSTFGEMSEADKNRISHRSRALDKLKAHLKNR